MRIDLTAERYPDARRRAEFFDTVRGQIESLPGVVAAGSVSRLPIAMGTNVTAGGGNPFSIEGQRWHPNGPVPQMAHNQTADAGYFRAIQIPLSGGARIYESDRDASHPVVIVNESWRVDFFREAQSGNEYC